MNVGGIFLLIMVLVGAVAGFFAIAVNMNMNAPVDSNGTTTSMADNLTRSNVSSTGLVIPTAGAGLLLVFAAVLLAIAGIYIWTAGQSNGRYTGRGR